ncbi:DUF4253 domain-containing protein [uncultured Pseudoteredinibacter sp.]|uniref:DUF4253 domain-containing protein n=1 Tax=uncultured Pseudoteredinibacter sp. TaxID=1641701 RepID=UPI00260E37EB|nr:DUF4253 domain-containing protein [uncultured Pseudoteredinibacter sp.]
MEFLSLNTQTAFAQAVESIHSDKRLIVCGSEEDKQYIDEAMELNDSSPDEIIASMQNVDVQAWLDARKQELCEEDSAFLDEAIGEWPGEILEKPGFSLAFDMLSGQAHQSLVGALIETDNAWKVPAFFGYGGWNDCPMPEVHCAIWKYWQEKYGAHIVAVSNDIIEAHIENPPTTQEEAMALALEQYLYCADIVDQGVETVANLAALLMNNHCWYFWWD